MPPTKVVALIAAALVFLPLPGLASPSGPTMTLRWQLNIGVSHIQVGSLGSTSTVILLGPPHGNPHWYVLPFSYQVTTGIALTLAAAFFGALVFFISRLVRSRTSRNSTS